MRDLVRDRAVTGVSDSRPHREGSFRDRRATGSLSKAARSPRAPLLAPRRRDPDGTPRAAATGRDLERRLGTLHQGALEVHVEGERRALQLTDEIAVRLGAGARDHADAERDERQRTTAVLVEETLLGEQCEHTLPRWAAIPPRSASMSSAVSVNRSLLPPSRPRPCRGPARPARPPARPLPPRVPRRPSATPATSRPPRAAGCRSAPGAPVVVRELR